MSDCCVGPRVVVGGASPPPPEPVFGEAFADPITDLQPTPSGQWTPVAGAEVTLPEAGTYQLSTEIRSRIINAAGDNGWIGARLVDTTTGAVVPNSERMINQAVGGEGTRNLTGPVGAYLTVTQPTTVQLETKRQGNSTAADIRSDANGWTRLAYLKIGGM